MGQVNAYGLGFIQEIVDLNRESLLDFERRPDPSPEDVPPISAVIPRKAGLFAADDEGTSYRWAIFDKSKVESTYGAITPDNALDIAAGLTGWHRSYGGPGRSFSSDPTIQVFTRNVLVKCMSGLDI